MKKLLLLSYLFLLVGITAFAQANFITTWDLSKDGSGTNDLITFGVRTAVGQAINYTWTANGGTPISGNGTIAADATMASITGLPANQVITLIIEPQNLKAFRIFNGGDKMRLMDVKQWGTSNWSSMFNAFSGCVNLDISATDVPNLGSVNNMNYMFSNCRKLNGPANINSWNTAAVTNMSYMFFGASVFNQNIAGWNTASVSDMSNMFANASAFNQNIGGWNTVAVTNMSDMFANADAFNQNIGGWNTAAVTTMSNMFNKATAFNQNIENWTLNAIVYMADMLSNSGLNCANYSNTLIGWASNSNTPTSRTLGATGKTYGTDAAAARATLISRGWTITGDVAGTSTCNLPFTTQWDLSMAGSGANQITFNVTTALGQAINYTWTANGGSPTSGVGTIPANAVAATIIGLPANQVITLNIEPQNLKAFAMSWGEDALRLIDVKQWGTSNWSTMEYAFYGCENLIISATDVPNFSNVTNMTHMFARCFILDDVANINLWNTASVTDMRNMFVDAALFNQNISAWNTSAVTNMAAMFSGANTFNQNISAWNASAVTNMNGMFYDATAFNQNIGSWNTSKVTNMSLMFFEASAFNQDISTWNVLAVTEMDNMFYEAKAFNQNLGNWVLNANANLNMFNLSGLNCANYSSTLIGWANNVATPIGRNLGATGLTYGTDAAAARATLENKGWAFYGDVAGASACVTTLPVTFGGFTAAKQTNNIKLIWNTLSESNNKGFFIQKSTDGIIFTDLAFIASKGQQANQYTLFDYQPANGTNYYRLIQQDINGKPTDLGTKVVNYVLANADVKAWPNPVSDVLNISFAVGKYQSLNLVDVNDRKLQSLKLTQGQSVVQVTMANYPKGVYIIELKGIAVNQQIKIVK